MDVIFSEERGVETILLNRPRVLNALTYEMVHAILQKIRSFQGKMVVVRGAGNRAFSAGADIRKFYELGEEYTLKTLLAEYDLNKEIHAFQKPWVSILDGIVMGGGAGLAMHGSHPIATDRLCFAMPEVKIGFFPDVGASFFLSRLKFHAAQFLMETGSSIFAGDAKHIGLIRYFIDHTKIEQLCSYLPDRLEEGLLRCAIDPGPPTLDWDAIDREYKNSSVELYESFEQANQRDRERALEFVKRPEFYTALGKVIFKTS